LKLKGSQGKKVEWKSKGIVKHTIIGCGCYKLMKQVDSQQANNWPNQPTN
jgi:hypothetical protein